MRNDRSQEETDDIDAYIEDRQEILDDPDRFGVAVIVTYLHGSTLGIDDIVVKQRGLGMSLTRERIGKIVSGMIRNGYISRTHGGGYEATSKLLADLRRDGLSKERLVKLANVLSAQT